jgi:hypothetical protein
VQGRADFGDGRTELGKPTHYGTLCARVLAPAHLPARTGRDALVDALGAGRIASRSRS